MTETGTGFSWSCFSPDGGTNGRRECSAEKGHVVRFDLRGGKTTVGGIPSDDVFPAGYSVSLIPEGDTARNAVMVKHGERLNIPNANMHTPTMS